ncbi:MAG TPA: glycosyltransferase family 39 protein, partial [Flavisolibacter sp.]|nr:glycosyltransferase family 39 protein [Flavisolibacter sp.]
MSAVFLFLLIGLSQLATGIGFLGLLRTRIRPAFLLPLALLLGLGLSSLLPFLLQLLFIPLTATAVFLSQLLSSTGLLIAGRRGLSILKDGLKKSSFRVRLYEIPFLLVITGLFLVSAWRCFYYPPTPRDLTSGAEVIAEYAVREKTMINSLFTVNLESTNNQFKPPFITSLQVLYKYAGFPFGQVWLISMVACFLIFLYHALCEKMHRVLAGLLLVFFMAIPEMYAYTFMALFDYPNAVYFFLSVFFLIRFYQTGERKDILLAGVLMGLATYIRSETLILACLIAPALLWHHVKNWHSGRRLLFSGLFWILPSVMAYLLSVTVYINLYLPAQYNVEGLVNKNLLNLKPLFDRFSAINSSLI